MIKPKSLIIGIAITIFLIKYFEYYLFRSELLSSAVYIVTFSFLYEMVSNFFNKEKKVVEGYSTNSEKKFILQILNHLIHSTEIDPDMFLKREMKV